jgi:hypothetical protein
VAQKGCLKGVLAASTGGGQYAQQLGVERAVKRADPVGVSIGGRASRPERPERRILFDRAFEVVCCGFSAPSSDPSWCASQAVAERGALEAMLSSARLELYSAKANTTSLDMSLPQFTASSERLKVHPHFLNDLAPLLPTLTLRHHHAVNTQL